MTARPLSHYCSLCFEIYKFDDPDQPGNPWLKCGTCRRKVHQQCELRHGSKKQAEAGANYECPECRRGAKPKMAAPRKGGAKGKKGAAKSKASASKTAAKSAAASQQAAALAAATAMAQQQQAAALAAAQAAATALPPGPLPVPAMMASPPIMGGALPPGMGMSQSPAAMMLHAARLGSVPGMHGMHALPMGMSLPPPGLHLSGPSDTMQGAPVPSPMRVRLSLPLSLCVCNCH